jgi:hypothetical protein
LKVDGLDDFRWLDIASHTNLYHCHAEQKGPEDYRTDERLERQVSLPDPTSKLLIESGRRRLRRMAQVNELVTSIRPIKFFAWELMFSEKIIEIRQRELKLLLSLWFNAMGLGIGWQVLPAFMIVLSFWCWTKFLGRELE